MRKKRRRGMTLIEILLVLALIGLLIRYVTPNISRLGRANARTGVRKMAALFKFCYDQSVLSGKIHRVVLDITTGKQSWELEIASGDKLPDEKIKDDMGTNSSSSNASDKKADTGFVPAPDSGKHRRPNGINIVEVKSWRLGEGKPMRDLGSIAIYCFPNGFIDDATISLQEEGRKKAPIWTIKTRSLTGRVDIDVEQVK